MGVAKLAAVVAAVAAFVLPGIHAQEDLFDFIPEPTGTTLLTETMKIEKDEYDGGGMRLEISDENETLIRVSKDGATVKNLIVGPKSGRGIKCSMSCNITDVVFEDVGEKNAISLVSTAPDDAVLNITGGGMRNAANVGISVDAASTVIIKDYVFDGFKTAIQLKDEDDGTDVTIQDTIVRFSDNSLQFVLGEATDGEPNMVSLINLNVFDQRDDTPLCEGPDDMCDEEDVTNTDDDDDDDGDGGCAEVELPGGNIGANAGCSPPPPPPPPPPAPPAPKASSNSNGAKVIIEEKDENGGINVGAIASR